MDLTEENRKMNNSEYWKIFDYDVVDSTNEIAKKICVELKERFVVTANIQTSGKGQYGRKWLSPSGKNFLATFCVPQIEITSDILISFAAANAVCIVLKKCGFTSQCKWPNDIEINACKIAGILTEKINNWLLIGIGLNLNWPKKRSELESGKKYTSLYAESDEKFDVNEFVSTLSRELNSQINKSPAEVLKLYKSFWNKKRNIEILADDVWIPARQTGIDSEGALIVESVHGNIIKINTSARVRSNAV